MDVIKPYPIARQPPHVAKTISFFSAYLLRLSGDIEPHSCLLIHLIPLGCQFIRWSGSAGQCPTRGNQPYTVAVRSITMNLEIISRVGRMEYFAIPLKGLRFSGVDIQPLHPACLLISTFLFVSWLSRVHCLALSQRIVIDKDFFRPITHSSYQNALPR